MAQIAASICFTAAVIAAREGRYESAVLFAILCLANTIVVFLNERNNRRFLEADQKWSEAMTENMVVVDHKLGIGKPKEEDEKENGEF